MIVWVWDLHLGRGTAAATQMIAQRKQSASPCGEYLEHMFSAACKHLWLQQADQQCSGYTFLAVGSRRLWHEASLTLLLLSEFITFIPFMDHHFSNPKRRACRSQGREMHGAHSRSWWEAGWLICFCCRSLQTLACVLFALAVLLLLAFAPEPGWILMSFPPAQGFPMHSPQPFFRQKLMDVYTAVTLKLCKEYTRFFSMTKSEKQRSSNILKQQWKCWSVK